MSKHLKGVFFWGSVWILSLLLMSSKSWAATEALDWEPKNCQKETEDSEFIYFQDFEYSYGVEELLKHAEDLYISEKRTKDRAFFDLNKQELKIPYANSGNRVYLKLPKAFVQNVRRQIEKALIMDYVDAVNFSDMGHSHFLVPLDLWDKLEGQGDASRMQQLLEHKDLKFLYHTAERLKMKEKEPVTGKKVLIDDIHLQWRYWIRNILAYNDGSDRLDFLVNKDKDFPFNTVNKLEGHRWGIGFDINANKKGCFKYMHKGELRYFDISLYSINSDPSLVDDSHF